MKLINTPSLASANDKESIERILEYKAKEYEYSASRLQDYIGRAFIAQQNAINGLIVDKTALELEIKEKQEQMKKAKKLLAITLTEMGINELKDKSASVCSSITIKESVKEITEPKERQMTTTEMKELLRANGLQTTVFEDVTTDAKPANVSINFKRGKGVKQITKNGAIEVISNMNSIVFLDEVV